MSKSLSSWSLWSLVAKWCQMPFRQHDGQKPKTCHQWSGSDAAGKRTFHTNMLLMLRITSGWSEKPPRKRSRPRKNDKCKFADSTSTRVATSCFSAIPLPVRILSVEHPFETRAIPCSTSPWFPDPGTCCYKYQQDQPCRDTACCASWIDQGISRCHAHWYGF